MQSKITFYKKLLSPPKFPLENHLSIQEVEPITTKVFTLTLISNQDKKASVNLNLKYSINLISSSIN